MADFFEESIRFYNGLSSETKPTVAGGTTVPNGSRYREVDTSKEYFYNKSDDTWYDFAPSVSVSSGTKVQITDGTDDADVYPIADTTDNLDGLKGVVTAAGMYGRITSAAVRPIQLDDTTHVMTTIEYPHHEIHSGSHYSVKSYNDVANGNVVDIQITVANNTAWPHLEIFFDTETEYLFWFYENVVINTAGTAYTPMNRNRNSANTANTTVGVITNTSIANANADTAIAGATLVADGIVGSGRKIGGESTSRLEIILDQGAIYSLRMQANAAGWTNWLLDWYEHTDKN